MARLKRLSSREILRLLGDFGFQVESMRGSHAKLVPCAAPKATRLLPRSRCRRPNREVREVLVVPVHRESRIDTVRAIYWQASRFVPEDQLKPRFFS